MAIGGKKGKDKPPAISCSCGLEMVEIPFVQRDGTKMVRVGKPDDYELERIGGSGPREMGRAYACKECDTYDKWPRSK